MLEQLIGSNIGFHSLLFSLVIANWQLFLGASTAL